MTKNSPANATGAHISIVGHITKEELNRNLQDTEAANGFANRFLWVCAKRSKCLPDGGKPDAALLDELGARIANTLGKASTVGEIKRTKQANQLWRQVYPKLSEGMPGLLGAVISRAEAQVMRLALVYALLDQSECIKEKHLQAALAVWNYCEHSARFIFGARLGDPVADTILQTLRHSKQGLTRTEVCDLFGRHKKESAIARALAVLAERGLAYARREETEGRPVERWFWRIT